MAKKRIIAKKNIAVKAKKRTTARTVPKAKKINLTQKLTRKKVTAKKVQIQGQSSNNPIIRLSVWATFAIVFITAIVLMV